MFPDIDRTRSLLSNAPLILCFGTTVIVGLFLISANGFDGVRSPWATFLNVFLFFGLMSYAVGIVIKYRSKISVKFAIGARFYGLVTLEFLAGGAVLFILQKIVGFGGSRITIMSIYIPTIIGSVAIAYFFKYRDLKENGKSLEENLSGSVDFKNYTIATQEPETKFTPYQGIAVALGVNVPLLFYIFTGSRDNAIFLLVPLMAGLFVYLNMWKIGPELAILYLLRKHEIKTGRKFKNADYEEIQDLRRTFWLSRWLMKDYRGKTRAKSAGAAMK
jgi:hypothetical protein